MPPGPEKGGGVKGWPPPRQCIGLFTLLPAALVLFNSMCNCSTNTAAEADLLLVHC